MGPPTFARVALEFVTAAGLVATTGPAGAVALGNSAAAVALGTRIVGSAETVRIGFNSTIPVAGAGAATLGELAGVRTQSAPKTSATAASAARSSGRVMWGGGRLRAKRGRSVAM